MIRALPCDEHGEKVYSEFWHVLETLSLHRNAKVTFWSSPHGLVSVKSSHRVGTWDGRWNGRCNVE